jgi:hypothetical protein
MTTRFLGRKHYAKLNLELQSTCLLATIPQTEWRGMQEQNPGAVAIEDLSAVAVQRKLNNLI